MLRLFCALLAIFAPTTARADENGAKAGGVDLSPNSAWVFNLPGARAIALSGSSIADSGECKTRIAPSGGGRNRVTRVVGAYVDVVGIDGGARWRHPATCAQASPILWWASTGA